VTDRRAGPRGPSGQIDQVDQVASGQRAEQPTRPTQPAPTEGAVQPERAGWEEQAAWAAAFAEAGPERVERSAPLRAAAHRRPPAVAGESTTVHVTIGRVEVRAVPGGPGPHTRPDRGRAGEPATTTLDQYLRRRAQGQG
jgi:hypothetical protein